MKTKKCTACDGDGHIPDPTACFNYECCGSGTYACSVCLGEGEVPDEEDQQPSAA